MKILLLLTGLMFAGTAQAQVQSQSTVDFNAVTQQQQRNNEQLAGANEQNAQNLITGSQALAEFGREPDLGRSIPSDANMILPSRRCASKVSPAPTNEWAVLRTPGGGCYLRRKP